VGTITVLGKGRFLQLVDEDTWERVERISCTGVIAVVAVTADGRILLVEQYRPALGKPVIELPAGLVGDEPGDESEAQTQAAHRELIEETGYEAESMTFLTEGPTSSGMSSEEIAFYRAEGIRRMGEGGGTSSEEITVYEVPIDDACGWLDAQAARGARIDPKVYAGLYFATH
jgi:ADP-ribose diphosphatase